MKHKRAEAFNVLWYSCPSCSASNSVKIESPYFQKGFNCKDCKSIWTCDGLFRAYGTIFPPKDKMDMLCTEFVCECGNSNLIFIKITETIDKSHNEEMRVRIEGGECPKFGLCEECGEGYDLIYPESEAMERWQKENE